MKDLYKNLGVDPDAPPATIRAALPAADEPTRAAAEFILLTPRRRIVYNRNHRLLTTIGQLRGRLALGLRPFWSHGHHQDFTFPFGSPGGRTDPISFISAAGHRSGHRRSARLRWRWLALVFFLVAVATWIWIWKWRP